ncbi:MAG: hypothetical protein GQ525_08920 [Draconibacterium sp.]|nr:hypothetical protein [Draconibacterium sp.]
MKHKLLILSISISYILIGCNIKHENNRIQSWDENSWYWQFNGEPVLLLGASSDDNLFQWPKEILIPHLDSMKYVGANYVRNTMSDRQDKGFELYPFIQLENGKYDLDKLNDDYYERFEFFLQETEKRDIIVQIEIWDRFDYARNHWPVHPFNPKNNINYTSAESGLDLEYPDHPGQNKQAFFFTTPKQRNNKLLLKYQKKRVEKILEISLKYNNVLYCIDNETSGEEEWAIFWSALILNKAKEADKNICVTEMWDNWDLTSEQHKRTFDYPERYVFCDVSQNNQKKGQVHWDNFQWVKNYLSAHPRPLNTVKTYGLDGGRHGNTKDGIERWWRHVLGGAATARFHRPDSGLGLSKLSMNCVRVAREIEKTTKFWNLQPGNDLLSDREENEAYLTSKSGETYVIFFTDGGEVGLDLNEFNSEFSLKWFNIRNGEMFSENILNGGKIVKLSPPGELEWIAVINLQ